MINGGLGSGKSTISLELAQKLQIKQIVDTDIVREVLRSQFSENEKPYLFKSSYNAWQILGRDNDKNIIDSFLNYSKELQYSIERILDRVEILGKDMIIEGIHLVPSMFKKYLKNPQTYHFLIYNNSESHLKNIHKRKKEFHEKSIGRFLENYPKIRIISNYLYHDAKKNKCNIILNKNIEDSIQRIIKELK